MTQRTEAEIRAAEAMRVAGDDEIVEAMLVAANDACNDDDEDHAGAMRAALDAARPMIERAARASADAEIAELRASLAKAEEDRRDALDGLAESQLSEQELTQAAHDLDLKIEDLQADNADLRSRVAELGG